MRRTDHLGRLIGWGFVGAGGAFIAVAWYAYFLLKRKGREVEADDIILATLLFGVCVLVAIISRGFGAVDLQRLGRRQHVAMAIAAFMFAVGSLWLAVTPTQLIIDGPLVRALLVIGFISFMYGGLRYLWEAWKRSP